MKFKGYSLITGVLLLSATIIVALLSIASLNLQSGEDELSARFYHELRAFGDGCMEEGFIRLKRDTSFTLASLSEGDNSCTINVVGTQGNAFRVSVAAENTNGQSLNIIADVERNISQGSVNIKLTSFSLL